MTWFWKLPAQSWSVVAFLQSGTYMAPPISIIILKKMKMSHRRMNLLLKTTNHLYYAFLNCNYGILFACFWYCHRVTRFVHVRTRCSNISHARLVIESGDYFVQHIQKCSDNLRAATNQVRRLIKQIRYTVFQNKRLLTVLWDKWVHVNDMAA